MSLKIETLTVAHILLFMLVGFASSDLAQDRTECANQLQSLATCLPYVGGQANVPTLDCCSGLKQVLNKSKKCLCILIKDRDDPNLGLKINATRAAILPSSCNAPANFTECIDILHLAPNSSDAKVFAAFANITKGSNSAISTASGNSTSTGVSASAKSDGGMARRWFGVEIIYGILLCLFIFGI